MLKDNLSLYLRYVREGESVFVTDRDVVIAEIHRPVHPSAGLVSRWDAFLHEQQRRGAVHAACGVDPGELSALGELSPPPQPVDLQRLLAEVKAD